MPKRQRRPQTPKPRRNGVERHAPKVKTFKDPTHGKPPKYRRFGEDD